MQLWDQHLQAAPESPNQWLGSADVTGTYVKGGSGQFKLNSLWERAELLPGSKTQKYENTELTPSEMLCSSVVKLLRKGTGKELQQRAGEGGCGESSLSLRMLSFRTFPL